MVTRSQRTSPLMAPSTCSSPPPVMLSSRVMSAAISEAAFCARCWGVRSAGSPVCVIGSGFWGAGGAGGGLFGLLNIVAGLHETQWVLGAAVHPHFIVQMIAGGAAGGAH